MSVHRRRAPSEDQRLSPSPGRRRVPLVAIALAMTLSLATSALAQTYAIPRNASWKYNATGVDLGTDWREPFYCCDFDWSIGATPLGYGYPDIVTTISYGPDSMNKYITTYLRRPFTISVNPSTVQGLTLNVNYDDGFVVYINGTEVARRSMPGGPVTYGTLAISHQVEDFESIDLSGATPALVQGANYMAVELHQESASSNDLYWNAELVYFVNPTTTRGPYLQVGTHNRVNVHWRTGFPTNSRVRYGTTIGSLTQTVDNATSTTEHEITLTGLTPNTRYYYSIGTTTFTIEGDDAGHTFMTAPAPGSQKPTRFWAIGDFGNGSSAQMAVRDAYTNYTGSRDADIWLMLGDNAYNSGTDTEYQVNVFDIYKTLLKKTIVWPTRGNHDNVHAPPSSDYYGIFTMPTAAYAATVESDSAFVPYNRFVIVPMFLFSGTFYPLDAYPEQIRLLVELTPLYQGVDLLRSLAVGVVGLDDAFHAAYLAAMGVVGLLVVSRRLDKLLLK